MNIKKVLKFFKIKLGNYFGEVELLYNIKFY